MFRFLSIFVGFGALLMAFSALAEEGKAAAPLKVSDAWVREAHPLAKVHAGYLTFTNPNANAVFIVAAQSENFGKVELHDMTMADGMMQMRELDHIVVPANGAVTLAPKGMHLMLKQAKVRPVEGAKYVIRFALASGEWVSGEFVVKKVR